MENSELRTRLAELHAESFGWSLNCCRGDRSMAEEVLQVAYLKALDGRAVFSGGSTLKTWFFGVVRNTAREEKRRHRLRRLGLLRYVPEARPNPTPQQSVQGSETREQLLRLMERLSTRQRETLHLVFYQDLTIEEAARVLGISTGSARTHYERGKQRLRQHLNSDPPA